jgi:hypothetical protein
VFALINSGGSKSNTPTATSSSVPAGTLGYEGIPLQSGTPLAGLEKAATGQTINGIECGATEQLNYHIHSHLTIYVDGVLRAVPLGIGIVEPTTSDTGKGLAASATKCYYWLHTHTNDGIVHVESPTSKLYPLSDFFAIWGQPLSSDQVGPAKGTVTAYVNGKKFTGDPQTITLSSHEDIQLNVGKDVPPVTTDWSKSQL